MKILLLFLLFIYANSSEYPNFTEQELKKIAKNSGNIAKNRVVDYTTTIDSFINFPKDKQLIKVNSYLNQLLPQHDILNQRQDDHWETPKEFLIGGYGDCEDYAIIKYYTLIKLGFDKEKFFITTVFELYTGGYHMVLSYFKSKNEPPLILDNLSFRILDLQIREDLKADLFMNEKGSYKIDKDNNLIRINKAPKKLIDLMKKIKKGL